MSRRQAIPVLLRVLAKVEYDGGCWLYKGGLDTTGYGRVMLKCATPTSVRTTGAVHRVVYAECVGPIPSGMTLDHLCRNRACCNPLHMDVITLAENIRRGESISTRYARRATCPAGHQYDGISPSGGRRCSLCVAVSNKLNYAKRAKNVVV